MMATPWLPADDAQNRARQATQNRCLAAATALVAGLVMLTTGRNDAQLAAGALSLAIAVLLGVHAYRHRYQAHGGSPRRHLTVPDPRFFLMIAALALTVAILAGVGLLIQ
ncbi:hypothetical protein Sru01_29940 [Sphaerisporangium rufum]|uniref:Uncharacterized protein n=1 Tax=Sphaerisporangium rufum TaxID=1381558 RepID=A0A919V0Z0_9ACTN|nr:hypothetical protein [Sphaerisporangium rufum]GII78012.1 hypothetical protein Sru01_29940 [Sphaerisporangium rufum]